MKLSDRLSAATEENVYQTWRGGGFIHATLCSFLMTELAGLIMLAGPLVLGFYRFSFAENHLVV